MARIGDEHDGGTRSVEYNDFRGGLNTSATPEIIAMNELVRSVNVEVESLSGGLKTVAGTDVLFFRDDKTAAPFKYLIHDPISKLLLITDGDNKVYSIKYDGTDFTYVGLLSGSSTVEYAVWEDGVVIASGGCLQYYHNGVLEDITDDGSPTECHAPFIKNGRIYVAIKDELRCSAVGDEHGWKNDSNNPSSAQWLQIGYKDGGVINGLTALSSDVLIFKDNNHAYHLAGSFPDWKLNEIGRQIDCKGFNACIALAEQTLALGTSSLQSLQVTDAYGDMKPTNLSQKIQGDIVNLAPFIKLRYMPSLNQVWLIDGLNTFLFLDMNTGGFFHRRYTQPIVDAIDIKNTVFVLKANKLSVLNGKHMIDDGEMLRWNFQCKTLVTNNQFLVKRERIDTTPMFDSPVDNIFYVDRVGLYSSIPRWARFIWHDYRHLYRCRRDIFEAAENIIFTDSDEIYMNDEYVCASDIPIRATVMYRSQLKQIDRNRSVRIKAKGAGGCMVINSISYDVVEV